MDYYSDDYPDVSLQEFLAVYERLTRFARREVHDLAALLAGGLVGDEENSAAPACTVSVLPVPPSRARPSWRQTDEVAG